MSHEQNILLFQKTKEDFIKNLKTDLNKVDYLLCEKNNTEESVKNIVDDDLISFFDLLARFDHEDKLKEKSELKTDLLSTQPLKGSVLGSDI